MSIHSLPWFFFISFSIILHEFKGIALTAKEEFCSVDGCEDKSTYSNLYTSENNEEWSDITKTIALSVNGYKPCEFSNCSCFTELVGRDLAVFINGISKEDLQHASPRGTRYQIISHKLYRDKDCMFPSRCSGIEHFIKAVIEHLPDIEFIVNTRDWPQASRHFGQPLPILSFSKTDDYYDITYPAWTFWEGGPAISLYPTGLGRWDKHRVLLNKASLAHPWEKKLNKAFFRGSRTSSERDPLVLLSREDPSLVDAQYTKNQAWKSDADTLGAQPAKEVALEDHCAYKYLFNYRGVAASFRFKHLFLCKSLVFHVGSEWTEFFYPALKPWVHYIPVSSGASKEDIARLIRFARANDDLVAEIAARGHAFVWNHLKMSDVECYWQYLLTEYGKLLRFKPVRDQHLIAV